MPSTPRIAGYTFQADVFCPGCIVNQVNGRHPNAVSRVAKEAADAEVSLDLIAESLGFDRYDEATFDSGDFPKVIFGISIDADEDERCAQCGKVLH